MQANKDGHDEDNDRVKEDEEMEDRSGNRAKNVKETSRDSVFDKPAGAAYESMMEENGPIQDGAVEDMDNEDLLDDWDPIAFAEKEAFLVLPARTAVLPIPKPQLIATEAHALEPAFDKDMAPDGDSAENTAAMLKARQWVAAGEETVAAPMPILNLHKTRNMDKEHPMEIGGTPSLTSQVEASLITPERRSKRTAANSDEDSLQRAARLVAKKNLEEQEGKIYDNSFLSLSVKSITDNYENVGISLGTEVTAVQASVSLIKKVEKDRFNSFPVKTTQDSHSDIDIEDSDLELSAINMLCGDLVDDVVDDDNGDILNRFDNVHTTNNPQKHKSAKSRLGPKAKKHIVFQ